MMMMMMVITALVMMLIMISYFRVSDFYCDMQVAEVVRAHINHLNYMFIHPYTNLFIHLFIHRSSSVARSASSAIVL